MILDPQLGWAAVLGIYVLSTLYLTRLPYEAMVARGMEPIRAVYYNRKIVHMAGAGVASLMVPLVFTDIWYPLIAGILFSGFTWITHALNMRLYWFQVEENRNDFKFAISWLGSVTFLWWLFDDPWLAILPALFMAFGDGVTGIARNHFVRRRSKSPIGNFFMLLVSAPMGWVIGGLADPAIPVWGLIAGVIATVVERYEFGPIDDNILITLAATATLLIGTQVGPLL
ncbi:MAG: phytol kinase [Halieaceae bacterium]|jgi:phytol kinase